MHYCTERIGETSATIAIYQGVWPIAEGERSWASFKSFDPENEDGRNPSPQISCTISDYITILNFLGLRPRAGTSY